jgi:arylsulfatase A-like enzyme
MKPKNIILITIDALRADHLSCYGYSRKTSFNIDKLAEEGILFENAFSSTNATDPSVTTILSGKYPISHGIRNHGPKVTNSMIQDFYKRKIRLLSEILRDNGYKTFGIDWLGRWHKKGFEYYSGDIIKKYPKILLKIVNRLQKVLPKKIKNAHPLFKKPFLCLFPTARELTNKALEVINNCKTHFFLFIHYWDTHAPYNAPKNVYTRFKSEGNSKELKDLLLSINNKKWREYLLRSFGEQATTEEVTGMYDSAIRYVDQEIGRLVDFLKSKGIYDDTIFVITSDHGESLTEHEIFFNHHGLYDESIHVPLIFNNIPLHVEQKRPKCFVQHVDIVSTLLDILNIPFNNSEFDGISLVPVMRREPYLPRSFIVAEEFFTQEKMTIRTKEWKYIYSSSEEAARCRYCGVIHGGIEELYHLESDPKEIKNIAKERPHTVKELRKKLFDWLSVYSKEAIFD